MVGAASSTRAAAPAMPCASGSPRSSSTQSNSPGQLRPGLGKRPDPVAARCPPRRRAAARAPGRRRPRRPRRAAPASGSRRRRTPARRVELSGSLSRARSSSRGGDPVPHQRGTLSARTFSQTPSGCPCTSGSELTRHHFAEPVLGGRLPDRLGGRPDLEPHDLAATRLRPDAPPLWPGSRAAADRDRSPRSAEKACTRGGSCEPSRTSMRTTFALTSTRSVIGAIACRTALVTISVTSRLAVSRSAIVSLSIIRPRTNRRAVGTLSVRSGNASTVTPAG